MVEGCPFSSNDIPFCPTTASTLPESIITYDEARALYKREVKKDADFHCNAYVCFYIDDYKFDSRLGIWQRPSVAYCILRHFEGIITPDFSTYLDFPDPLKRYNVYRCRAWGYWYGKCGGNVINNVRWGTSETWKYCFDGLPSNDILAIGTVASGLKHLANRPVFDEGIRELVKRLAPHTLLIYGSSNYPIFEELRQTGIKIISYESKTNRSFQARKKAME